MTEKEKKEICDKCDVSYVCDHKSMPDCENFKEKEIKSIEDCKWFGARTPQKPCGQCDKNCQYNDNNIEQRKSYPVGPIMFKEELSYIKSDIIRTDTMICLNNTPSYFFKVPASSTGKYHPNYALGEGGLVRHTKAAVKIANDLLSLEQYSNMFDDERKDYIIAALILHDTYKSGVEQAKYTCFDHPLIAAEQIRQLDSISEGFKLFVPMLIESHMGQWNTAKYSPNIVLPKPGSPEQQFVHMCDYLASRKYIEIEF